MERLTLKRFAQETNARDLRTGSGREVSGSGCGATLRRCAMKLLNAPFPGRMFEEGMAVGSTTNEQSRSFPRQQYPADGRVVNPHRRQWSFSNEGGRGRRHNKNPNLFSEGERRRISPAAAQQRTSLRGNGIPEILQREKGNKESGMMRERGGKGGGGALVDSVARRRGLKGPSC